MKKGKISKINKKHKKKEKKDCCVYIVLTQTRTYPARLIRLYTGEPYAHASIAFDEDLEEMYSFARKTMKNPFNAGFIKEDIESGIFGRYVETTCGIYKLKLTQEQYKNIRREVEMFKKNAHMYSYNFLGIVGVMVHIPRISEHKYFCSQFVAHILEKSGVHLFNKNCALVRPFDIRMCPKLKKVYEGKLTDYRDYVQNNFTN